MTLRIALVQSNSTGLEKALYDVSNPASENYGHHLTKAEVCASFIDVLRCKKPETPCSVQVEAMVAPAAESIEKVQAWLSKNNITAETISPSGDMLKIQVPVSQANTLLSAEYNEYTHDTTNQTRLRTLGYSLPETVKDHVAFIYPTTQ